MKRYLNKLKNSNFVMPIWFGKAISFIPFSIRPGIGRFYKEQKKLIINFEKSNIEDKEKIIFDNFYKVFKHAYLNVPFYTNLYKNVGLKLTDIKCLADIQKIPIVSKKDLIAVPLEERSYPIKNRLKVNTGGSSGKPFSFYMDPLRYGNEWAHIHSMWSQLGYSPNKLKLSFDGRSTVMDYVQYDIIRHSLRFDIYSDKKKACNKLLNIIKKYNVEYLHGYPSAISEFAHYCLTNEPELLIKLRKTLKGAFLSSEFPSPHYRNTIEEVFSIPTQSFYGHTETCVMAFENEKFIYSPFQTYGYTEGVNVSNGGTDLIGTSYFNFASPLIRYNTEDNIEIIDSNADLLAKFKIKDGRKGEFLLDKNNMKIPLTGLLFGRHHKIFDISDHVQVCQTKIGYAKILYVSDIEGLDVNSVFDSSNVEIEFSVEKISNPILTKSGKINLLVEKLVFN